VPRVSLDFDKKIAPVVTRWESQKRKKNAATVDVVIVFLLLPLLLLCKAQLLGQVRVLSSVSAAASSHRCLHTGSAKKKLKT